MKTIIKYLRQKLDKQLKELHKKDTTKRATEIINILLKIFDLPPEEMKKNSVIIYVKISDLSLNLVQMLTYQA